MSWDYNKLSHDWFHNSDKYENKSTAGNRMFYYGDSIYSYGHHFKIAQKYSKDSGVVVLITCSTSSKTTTKHINCVKSAIPGYIKTIKVYSFPYSIVDNDTHSSNIKRYIEEINDSSIKQKRARTSSHHLANAHSYHSALCDYVKMFDCEKLLLGEQLPYIKESLFEEFQDVLTNYEEAKLLQKQKEQKDLEKKNKKNISLWKKGNNVSIPSSINVLLRIKDEEVETSRGASIPIADGVRLWSLVCHVKNVKQEWLAKDKEFAVGKYALQKITKTGDVSIDCHNINYSELLRIAKQLKLNV